jgi:hypothetical protein
MKQILDALVQSAPQLRLEQEKEMSVAHLRESISSQYAAAQSYTSVIAFGGYAGFFAIWSGVEKHVSRLATTAAFFLIAVSLVSFVLWEIYKMLKLARELQNEKRLIEMPAQSFSAKKAAIDEAKKSHHIEMLRAWSRVFWFSAITGFSAGAVLLVAIGQSVLMALFV